MSIRDSDADDWFRRFMGGPMGRFGFGGGRGSMFREFEEMRREMERMMEETIQDIDRLPKDLVREYETPTGGKVREVGPIVYGYSVTVGPDGKPKVREFGNVKPVGAAAPQLTAEREPLADVVTTGKEVKVVVELPGASKQSVKINALDSSVEVTAETPQQRKYRRVIEIPPDADIETAKSSYNNGILEIVFNKKAPPRGKQIKVD